MDQEERREIVTVGFKDSIYVMAETEKAIGLSKDSEQKEVDFWLPVSQIDGDLPGKGDWIDQVRIPRWLADEKNLEG